MKNTNSIQLITISQRQGAIVAGLSILIMALIAFFSFGFVLNGLMIPDDPATTLSNIQGSQQLFRGGIGGWMIILICDVLAAWALHIVLRNVNQELSGLTALLRLTYAGMLAVAIVMLMLVAYLSDGTEMAQGQVISLVELFLNGFTGAWSLGLIVFGGHLLLLGYLVFKSESLPKWIGIFLLIGGLGYMLVSSGKVFFPDAESIFGIVEMVFMLPMVVGELGLAVWLLLKGGKWVAARFFRGDNQEEFGSGSVQFTQPKPPFTLNIHKFIQKCNPNPKFAVNLYI